MITVFTEKYNQISQSIYDTVILSIQLHRLVCTCGHAACLSPHAYYNRTVKSDNEAVRIRILRVKCSECGRTHAILLSSIVPYSQIPLAQQRRICLDYEAGNNVFQVCEQCLSIDENNVKSVIRNYWRHWREMLRSMRILLTPVTELIRSCFSHYSLQFMQIHRGKNQLFNGTT